MSYFLRERDEYGEMGTYSFAKVLYKSRNLCGNFCKAKSPTHAAVCIYALTEFSVPLFSNTRSRPAWSVRPAGSEDGAPCRRCRRVSAWLSAGCRQGRRPGPPG